MHLVGFAFTDRALDFLEGLPPKIRKQVVKKAKALHTNPFPPTSKKLHDVVTIDGYPVHRERSGDYRVLYVVRTNPSEVIIIDIGDRKDVYRMPKTNTKPADEMRMKESDFDALMSKALGVPAPSEEAESDVKPKEKAKPKKTTSGKH